MPYRISIAIQVLKMIEKGNADSSVQDKISRFFSDDDKEYIKNNNPRITSGIYDELKVIGGIGLKQKEGNVPS